MINLYERMLPTSAGVEPATSWSPVGRRIQLSHRGRLPVGSNVKIDLAQEIRCFLKAFSSNQEDVTNNVPVWPVFILIWDFIHVHLFAGFRKIKPEWVVLIKKSNRGFFNNQGDVTLKINDPICPVFELFEISSMSTLSASFRNIR